MMQRTPVARSFFSLANLRKASPLAAVVTLMSLGRIVQGAMPVALYIPLTFGVMTFTCGAVTAWGTATGMAGIRPSRRILFEGVAVAALLSLALLPLRLWLVDPAMRSALATAEDQALARLAFPDSGKGCLAVMLWSAGFQAMFLYAAPMSLLAGLTRRRSIAVSLTVLLRTFVLSRQVAAVGLTESIPLFVMAALLSALLGCLVFGRYGLLPLMLLAAGMDLHLFF